MPARPPTPANGGRTATASSRFTDRKEHVAVFLERLDGPRDAPAAALMYYGVAGSGKRTLIDRLQEICRERRVPNAGVDLREAPTAETALTRLAGALEQRHRLKLRRFERVVVALAARTGEASSGGMMEPILDLALDSLALIPVVGSFTFVVKLGKGAIHGALQRAMEQPSVRAAMLRLGGQQELLELLERSEEELRGRLVGVFAEELDAAVRARKGRAVVFFEHHDVFGARPDAGGSDDAWLRELAGRLGARGHLVVIAGCDRLAWRDALGAEAAPVEERAVDGFAAGDAVEFLGKCVDAAALPEELSEALLRLTNEAPSGQPSRHHAFLLTLCAEVVRREREQTGRFPGAAGFEAVHRTGAAADPLVRRFLETLTPALGTWLEELALAPRFDEKFALELDQARHHGNRRAGWRQLRRLTLLEERERGFLEMHRLLREALQARVDPADAEEIHAWAYEYWTRRARQEWQEHGYYSLEQPRWQEVVALGFHHLCRSGHRVGDRRAALLFAGLVLDVYWWWCENLPFQFWTQLLRTTEAALRDAPGDPNTEADRWQCFTRVVRGLREFETAWPKGWLKDSSEWDTDVRAEWGDPVVDAWSWRGCVDRLEALSRELRLESAFERIAAAGADGIDPVGGHVVALLAYYLGEARHYRAMELERDGEPRLATACRKEAEGAYGVLETWFTRGEQEPLHAAWSRILLGDLYRSWGRRADALAATATALARLGPDRREVGAAMEGAADAHRVRAGVFLDRGKPVAAGGEMGRALIYAAGFRAADRDDYSAAYLRDARRRADRALREAHGRSPAGAAQFVRGARQQLQAAQGRGGKGAGIEELAAELWSLVPLAAAEPTEADYAGAMEWFRARCPELPRDADP